MADALTEIFRAANKHPNSRISKLIYQVEEEPTQKNIVLLLIELADHAEYSIDFNVSLKYYLELFERCGLNHNLVLNEAGLLLVNSSKIYSKRLDYVQSLVERQILTLSNADDELQSQRLEQEQTQNATAAEKPKRGRKRALEASSDPYEVELSLKKFKRLTEDKRFAQTKVAAKSKIMSRNIEMEQHIHPAGWQHATIFDFENEEDVDTKRNYKLFTFHVEHRYNTLVPDINFRLHFKVKDYMDEQEEMDEDEACNTDRSWPPLSEAYVQKYLHLENYVLSQDTKATKRKSTDHEAQRVTEAKVMNIQPAQEAQQQPNGCHTNESGSNKNSTELQTNTLEESTANFSIDLSTNSINKSPDNLENSECHNDSGLGQSILDKTDNTLENSQLICSRLDSSQAHDNSKVCVENDSGLGSSVLEQSDLDNFNSTEKNESALDTSSDLDENGNKSFNSLETEPENNTSKHAEVINGNKSDSCDTNDAKELNKSQQIQQHPPDDANKEVVNLNREEGNEQLKPFHMDESRNTTDGRGNSELHTIDSGENLTKTDFKSGESLSIDVVDEQDKNATQIHAHLPSADDEGVCLSDLDDHDCRLLSPIIKTSNILPGVERKDITIVMDDELRQALEMRDGIIKHFGCETFTMPVVVEPQKTNLIFNILQLPEKLVRRKILFKLGPDMDLYLQARSLKRSKAETVARAGRNLQFLKWYPLNNTDMTGICMTPPQSPDHVSEFFGFSDTEDDSISCVDFCGFTEEEQLTLNIKAISRLSRDSGVGVDGNNLTPDKESLESLFEEPEMNSTRENCTKKLNTNEMEMETAENILHQLPDDIRNALTLELENNSESNKEATNDNNTPSTLKESQLMDNSETSVANQTSSDERTHTDAEATEAFPLSANITKESDNSENSSLTQTQAIDAILTENSSEKHTCIEQSLANSEMESETVNTSAIEEAKTETKTNAEAIIIPCSEANERKDFENCTETPKDEMNDTEEDDGIKLDLDTQGSKTKIQKWHEHLQPILAKSRERHHFDIYKLGTEIIETVQTKTVSTSNTLADVSNSSRASFESVMEDKDKSYVSRYFLSTLLLANQNNIEISIQNRSSEKPSAWHDINLKLLSTKRHTVAIEDNIGLIDSKRKAPNENQNPKKVKNKSEMHRPNESVTDEEDEHEHSLKPQRPEGVLKTAVKRSSEYPSIPCVGKRKPKEVTLTTTESQPMTLPNLVQSVQIVQPPYAASSVDNSTCQPFPKSTYQAQPKHPAPFNINHNAIRTLQPIEKVQKMSDDLDSGIFSVDEMCTA